MKTAGCTDKDLLLSLKRLCTEKNCFRDAKPDDAVLDYYSGTMKMVEEELANSSAVDADRVEAIVSNMLMVISNAAVYFEDKSKDHRKHYIYRTLRTTEKTSENPAKSVNENGKRNNLRDLGFSLTGGTQNEQNMGIRALQYQRRKAGHSATDSGTDHGRRGRGYF